MKNKITYLLVFSILLFCLGCKESPKENPRVSEVPLNKQSQPDIVNPSSQSEFQPCTKSYDIQGVDLCLAWTIVPQEALEMHQKFSFELSLVNFGRSEALNSVVSVWAKNIKFIDPENRYSCISTGSKFDCTIPRINSNQKVVLRLEGTPFAAGNLTMTAAAENDADENLTNNEAKPFPKIQVKTSSVNSNDYTASFLEVRQKCVVKHGSDKLSLRKCMIEAKNAGQL